MTDPGVLLLGATSQIGYSLVQRYASALTPACSSHSRYPACADWPRIELDDADAVRRMILDRKPDLVLHCGGVCNVGKCERWPEFAEAINVDGVRLLLQALPHDTRLVYCSSDHVFGGDRGPYRESDPTRPLSVYGRTRCAAETLISNERPDALIIRHGLGIGPSIGGRSGHLDWLRSRTARGLPTTVVADEIRSAVWSDDLAERVWDLAHSTLSGIRHVAATAAWSRVDLARHLDARYAIGATLSVATRADQRAPHIGDVELATEFSDALARPLATVVS